MNEVHWEDLVNASEKTPLAQSQERLTCFLTQPGWVFIHGSSFESNVVDNFLYHVRDSVSPSFALNCRKLAFQTISAVDHLLLGWKRSLANPKANRQLIREPKPFYVPQSIYYSSSQDEGCGRGVWAELKINVMQWEHGGPNTHSPTTIIPAERWQPLRWTSVIV